jgi:transglutaminase-like putative cysteine protease
LPAHGARLIGFVLLATLGVAEWSRMIGGLGFARALVWVAVATAAGIGIWLCERLDPRRQGVAMLGVAACALVAAVPAAGLDAELLKPRRWGELAEGLGAGGDALAVVRLPYDGADPWPGHTLALLGALLCVLAGLLAMWPRERGWERGYPFLSLIALLVMAATPVVSLGGTRPLLFGGVLAMLTAAFLWLDRLPLRPGFGVAALLGVALAGAVPLAGAADRDAPWFDYRTFAEGLGPEQPARFDWRHSYDPITWPRDRKEVLRIRTKTPQYWKAETLDEFAGDTWFDRDRGEERVPVTETEVPAVVREDWTERFRVSVRRLRTANVVAAGTVLGIDAPTRPVRKTGGGDFVAPEELRRGDSYAVRAYVPRPTREQLAKSTAGEDQRQVEDLTITVGFRDDVPLERLPRAPGTEGAFGVARGAEVRFSPFATGGPPTAYYPDLGQLGDGSESLASSTYARTWRLAQRLRERARTPADYVVAVDRYLHRRGFTYSERPAPPADGVAPLDGFLFDTQEGYCQHYSGAMALLLRMGGVPARVASGFSPGGYSERRGEWIVRDTDAHSWVEAWFDDYGWVTFDPTPRRDPGAVADRGAARDGVA